jgi:hypothetical protein
MPSPHPLTGVTPANARDVDATIEDLTWLADHHVGAHEAARRTGFPSYDALEKWLRERHRADVTARLRAHDPIALGHHRRDPYGLERSA